MNDDSIGVIRRGWPDVAATLAPHVVGLNDLLERRLEQAARAGHLDEATLMAIVDAATQMAVDSGAADVASTLGNRLRRTVYEYLLSLDATSQQLTAEAAIADHGIAYSSALTGASEATEVGRIPWADTALEGSPGVESAAESGVPSTDSGLSATDGAPESAAIPNRESGHPAAPPAPAPPPPPPPPPNLDAGSLSRNGTNTADHGALAPAFGFHIGDPSDLISQVPPGDGHGEGSAEPEATGPFATNLDAPVSAHASDDDDVRHDDDAMHDDEIIHHQASFADPSTWPKPAAPSLRPARIQERTEPAPDTRPAEGVARRPVGNGELWPSLAPREPLPEGPAPGNWPEPRPDLGEAAGLLAAEQLSQEPPEKADEVAHPPPDALAELAAPQPDPDGQGAGLERQLEADEIAESDISELRVAVEEKLRKKRCDDAAAMLQCVAQDVGGRGVAELAVDAGDRCRALGKANAALNCFIAASRADPVFEAPLARLADICIDDQDIDLAVSYLERIARLTRLRGDNKGALRIYRKIAAVAPYRDDVLELLMRAHTTGRLEA